jgi:hypothetical protein
MEQGDVIRALHLTLAAQQAVRTASQPRLRLELAMVQLAVMDSTVNLTQLLEKIDGMPEGTGSHASNPTAAVPVPRTPAPAPAPAETTSEASPETPAKPGYASIIRENLDRGKEGKGISNVKDLASFPTTAPIVARQAIYTADPDVATMPRPANGNVASGILNGNGNGNGSVLYTTEVLDTLVMENGGAPAAGGWVESGLSLREIQGRWSEFLRSCDDKMLLASALQGAQPAEIHGSAIRLFVPQETQLTLLNRNRQTLNQKLTSFFNIPMQAEWTLGAPPVALPENDFPTNGNGAGPHADHPFIKGIMELLGASPLL